MREFVFALGAREARLSNAKACAIETQLHARNDHLLAYAIEAARLSDAHLYDPQPHERLQLLGALTRCAPGDEELASLEDALRQSLGDDLGGVYGVDVSDEWG